jgi:uncharacterized membrane protein
MAKPTRDLRSGAPLHPGFINAGGTLLIAAFATDLMYCKTSLWQWANFSAWLITAGLILALLATIVLVIDFRIGRVSRLDPAGFCLVGAAALLSLLNVFVHSRDGWTSVAPGGIGLSALVTILLLAAATRGWSVAEAAQQSTGDRA